MTLVIRKRDMPFLISRPKARRSGGGGAGRGGGGFRASGGSFVLTGQVVDLRYFKLAVGTGAFVLTGNVAALNIGPVMVAGAGAFVLTGNEAQFSFPARAIGAGVGAFLLGGQDVNMSVGAGGPTGDGILLEDGTSFLLAENDDFLIME